MIEQARALVDQAERVVSFSGAGLSAESGVPTFRDKADPDALWAKFDPMTLASPEGFARDPNMVMAWYRWRREQLSHVAPNAAHRALAARRDIFHVTQNVDDLLERAGASSERVVHLHGTIARDRCHASCGFEEAIDLAHPPTLRACPQCGDRLRPSVVWFGEALPTDAWLAAERACATCDALIVIGTSAAVYPAAGLIGHAKSAGARIVIINTHPSEASGLADVELIGRAGEIVPALLLSGG